MAFPATRWSLVAAAHGTQPPPRAKQALQELCAIYWPPLFAFARRNGSSPDDARDLVQGFFADFLGRQGFARVDGERGRFRSFLLRSFRNYCHAQHRNAQAAKRGCGDCPIPLHWMRASEVAQRSSHDDPERAFDHAFALLLLQQVQDALAREYASRGKQGLFDALLPRLTEHAATDLATLASELHTSEGALKVGLHRLRKRYGQLLRAEVHALVADPADVRDEIRTLIAAVANAPAGD